MASTQALPQLQPRVLTSRGTSRNSSRQVIPSPSKTSRSSLLIDTWMANLKGPTSEPLPVKDASGRASDDQQLCTQLNLKSGYSQKPSSRSPPDDPSNTSYDATDSATLLRKTFVHATSSRRLQGFSDLAVMLLALIPTALMRVVRAAMGLVGVTEHRWRGISMVVPLTPQDRAQLFLTIQILASGKLGRRPESPARGPVAPSHQLLLDLHAILAAVTSTAATFKLPYQGFPEAALHANLARYLRTLTESDSLCTQDAFKAMRKIARKTLTSLCAAAPRPSPTLSPPSSDRNPFRPKPRHVAKAFMVACLQQQCRCHAETLISLIAQLPDGTGDLVETMSLIPLAPGAEYLRQLNADPERFSDQLEAMTSEHGRMRPSDAKKEPEVQGMTINARIHEVGVVRYKHGGGYCNGNGHCNGSGSVGQKDEGEKEAASAVPGAVVGGLSGGGDAEGREGVAPSSADERSACGGRLGGGSGGGGRGVEEMEDGDEEGDDQEGLLQRSKRKNGTTSSQPDLLTLAKIDAATANGHASQTAPHPHASSSTSTTFTTASRLSTTISHYPTAALDVFSSLYAVPRSGAFAVHGRSPRGVGLARLTTVYGTCHSLPAASQGALLGSLGFSNMDELRREVELRQALCVAQALPVIVASLRLMCRSPACLSSAARTGCFLHVQQSLLSDLHAAERGYLEDTQGALELLGERLAVRFVAGSEKVLPLQVSRTSILVSLPYDAVPDAALAAAGLSREAFCGAVYGLSTALFNQGINSLQSLGFLIWRGLEPLQDSLNRQGLERLNEYAARANRLGGPALAALNDHYGPEGQRPPKDTAMFGLVRRACTEVGAGRAVNCKSGKDRTALELAKACADEVLAAGIMPTSTECRIWLEGQFLRGLSYITTSQNHGQPPAYAFNEMEISTLPAGWRPDWRLCGKVAT